MTNETSLFILIQYILLRRIYYICFSYYPMVSITPSSAAAAAAATAARKEYKRPRSVLENNDPNYSTNNQQHQQQQQDDESHLSETTKLFVPFNVTKENDGYHEQQQLPVNDKIQKKDTWNYALLIVLYTLQGIPIGLSASIPFLIQQKARELFLSSSSNPILSTTTTLHEFVTATTATTMNDSSNSVSAIALQQSASALSYNANAIFALCTWPFSLKLLWAPIVDSCFIKSFGRRKTWLVPIQTVASFLMIFGSKFVEQQLTFTSSTTTGTTSENVILSSSSSSSTTRVLSTVLPTLNVKGLTIYFFILYFLMATQDIAVDGWALTLLQKQNRGHGPVCNSIGQNIGYFISFVGFLAFNDIDNCEKIWRPLLQLPSNPTIALVSLGSFLKCMGCIMLLTTTLVAIFKHETTNPTKDNNNKVLLLSKDSERGSDIVDSMDDNNNNNSDNELDASEIGLKETYYRLWEVCKLPSVQSLFLILLTYRFPTAISDNVKFLKAVEYGLSKSATALLSPTIILPLGILVPIYATKFWHNKPLQQFMSAYKIRTTLVPIVDMLMLIALKKSSSGTSSNRQSSLLSSFFSSSYSMWGLIIVSTALQSIVSSLQFNAQMTFFAKRVDPAIGGSYMTLLNTAANLGGTWPASVTMWLVSKLSSLSNQSQQKCTIDPLSGKETCTISDEQQHVQGQLLGQDPFFRLQVLFSILGCLWIVFMSKRVQVLSDLPDDAWTTNLLSSSSSSSSSFDSTSYNNNNTTTKNITVLTHNINANFNSNDIEVGNNNNTTSFHTTFHKIHPE